ncbi:DUF4150 domain-containing protein [Ruegeria jejuensis]|uniref:DUF4150 domain-containing protein n=1 Tax=Ruegeria jejuensis TaxID=3233338 RepID=UPI00355C277F
MSLPGDDYVGEPGYPAPWTTSTPREGLRDSDAAVVVSLAPDVCKSTKTPIPYPVVEFCGHDEGYTPSVRFTGQKAMVFRSHTTDVHGDEPGRGGGVASGTCGGICEPIEHADQVRAEGSPVIRHLDRFHMNNRNTEGEAIFVRDMLTYAAPEDDDPLPGSMRSEKVFIDGAEYQVADASGGTINFFSPPAPGTFVEVPPIPGTQTAPQPQPEPSSPSNGPKIPWKWGLKGLGPFALLFTGYELGEAENQRAFDDPEGYMAREARMFGGVESFDAGQLEIHERAVERLRQGTPQGFVRDDYYREMQRYRQQRELDQLLRGPKPEPEPELEEDPLPVPPPGTGARITQRQRYRKKCEVDRYGRMSKICGQYGMQAHHIVPDYTLRYGTRKEGEEGINRIPNMPSLDDGMSICVVGNAATEETEHNRAHFADAAIAELGLGADPPHTARLADVVRESRRAMVAVRPDCAAQIVRALAQQYGPRNPDQLLRTKNRPPLPAETIEALQSGATASMP